MPVTQHLGERQSGKSPLDHSSEQGMHSNLLIIKKRENLGLIWNRGQTEACKNSHKTPHSKTSKVSTDCRSKSSLASQYHLQRHIFGFSTQTCFKCHRNTIVFQRTSITSQMSRSHTFWLSYSLFPSSIQMTLKYHHHIHFPQFLKRPCIQCSKKPRIQGQSNSYNSTSISCFLLVTDKIMGSTEYALILNLKVELSLKNGTQTAH